MKNQCCSEALWISHETWDDFKQDTFGKYVRNPIDAEGREGHREGERGGPRGQNKHVLVGKESHFSQNPSHSEFNSKTIAGCKCQCTMPLDIITWSIPGNTLCKKKCITYSFVVDNPNTFGHFLLFVGQDQLRENYLTFSHIWGPRIL